MYERILVAVDDSPGGRAAGWSAIGLALSHAAKLRAVQVLVDGELKHALAALPRHQVHSGCNLGPTAVLESFSRRAEMAGVPADTISLGGEPAHCILDEARAWAADVIVIGRSADTGGGRPRVGAAVQRVLEFAEQPVLVVPLLTARGDLALR